MGGGVYSINFSDIYRLKLESDILVPLKLNFYRKYVDGMFDRKKVNNRDTLLKQLDNDHPKNKLTTELTPKKLLDEKLFFVNGIYYSMLNRKSTKLPIAWSSKVRKFYKRNIINGD